ncbi:EAL and HDOD domain-containing protein [Acutalibacter caecimuris]|uniref:EAL and HDOD domain-containing protein n=1 Tax=Acutalibacter caecimuris TaxID=3093657 RepID=UPI002AC8DA18|nr:HDOD domain-containing protein [Acutalibacter sp. M00118]
MRERYIVRQPIKNEKNQIIAYELLYYGENQAYGSSDEGASEFAVADTVYSFLMQNMEKSLKDTVHFMTFTTTLLMKKTPALFPKKGLIIQIDDSVVIHPLALRFVQQYARDGYKIAVNQFQFAPRYLSLIDYIDYIKLNIKETNENSAKNIVNLAKSMNKKVIATDVDTQELYQAALNLNVDALEGPYVAKQLATKAHSSGYLQSNFFRLMVAVVREEPDMEEIENIISTDATLSYGLLRVANTAYFSTKHRVTTIRQAIMTLGIAQLKQWIYLLSTTNANNEIDQSAEEFLKLSFMRANFCSELMNYAKNLPISRSEAYLMGMFSTLNYLIDAPLEEILSTVPVADEVKAALLHHEGPCGELFDLVLSYEQADWDKITKHAEALYVPAYTLTSIYFNCTESVNETWKQITDPSGNELPEEVAE